MGLNFLYSFRRLFLLSITLCLSLLLVSCGGGGGGSSNDDDGNGGTGEGGNQTLASYDFNLSLLADKPLELGSRLGSETATARLEALAGPISGTYDMDTESITLNSGPLLKVTTDIWPGNEGILSINVNTPIVFSGTDDHAQAEIGIAAGGDFITITASAGNVNLNHGATSVDLSWDQFEGLLGSDADTWQQQAALAYFVVDFIFSQIDFTISTIGLIEKNDSTLQENESILTQGDTFPGSPPSGHDAQGTHLLEWIDSGDGDLGPGDSFAVTFSDFWTNETGDDISTIFQGNVSFIGFLEDMDESRDVVTAIGFVPNPGEPGGVFFDEGFTLYEVEQNPAGIFTIDDAATITIKGGYSIMFTESVP